MRKLGEPQRKACRLEEQQIEDEVSTSEVKPTTWPTPVADGPTVGEPRQERRIGADPRLQVRVGRQHQTLPMHARARQG